MLKLTTYSVANIPKWLSIEVDKLNPENYEAVVVCLECSGIEMFSVQFYDEVAEADKLYILQYNRNYNYTFGFKLYKVY